MSEGVSIRQEALAGFIRERLAHHLSLGVFEHANRDAVWSPSEWDVTADRQVRHSLQTAGSVSVEDGTVRVRLSYAVVEIPPRS